MNMAHAVEIPAQRKCKERVFASEYYTTIYYPRMFPLVTSYAALSHPQQGDFRVS